MPKNNRQLSEIILPSDANMWDKASDDATKALEGLQARVPLSEKGVANGVATLGADGKVLSSQLPILRKTFTTTLSTAWIGSGPYTQTVSISEITADMTPIVDVVLSATTAIAIAQLEAWGLVSKIVTGNGSIIVTCLSGRPTTSIPIQLKVVM